MRLVTFVQTGGPRLGALRTSAGRQTIVDLNAADASIPAEMIAFLTEGAPTLARARRVLDSDVAAQEIALGSVRLLAPIARPGKIMCIGLNYSDHAAESHADLPAYPTLFAKYASCIIGPGEAIVIPNISDNVDYEGELGVVIGRRARHVPEAEALHYVGGYLPFNDVSVRDFQSRTTQWTIGKTFDTHGPMGPALVTADEVPDPQNLALRVTVGNEVLQSSTTAKMIFSVAHLISYLSAVMTLEPGDLIATGTPDGVGSARKPPRWLRPGETVRVEIEGLGVLENPVVAEQ